MSMKAWWLAFVGALAVLAAIAFSIARMYQPARPAPVEEAPVTSEPSPPEERAHITATLFFGSPDGQTLVPARRDVALANTVVEQGRQIVNAELSEEAEPPNVTVIPAGTTLRAFYVTERGDAFVDLSSDVITGHPGGSLNELLTVYAIVNAVTANLPAVRRVQILVDGKEADTIAGHVDLRRPLSRDDSLVRESDEK